MEIHQIKCDTCRREIYSKINEKKDDFFTKNKIKVEFTINNDTRYFNFYFCSFPCFAAKFSEVRKDLINIFNEIAKDYHLDFRFLKTKKATDKEIK